MRLTSLALLAITAASGVAQAQQQSPAAASGGATTGSKVAIRPLGAVVATARDSLGVVSGVRALPGGRVLVNDAARRRVLMLDAALANPVIVVDSAAGAANSYGPRTGGLIPYRGDSTLFVDPASLSMLVIDPAGAVARVMSVPRSDDASALASGQANTPGFDAQGRLVYRGLPRFTMDRRGGASAGGRAEGGRPGGNPVVTAGGTPPAIPDTVPLVRVDLATRGVDTVGWVKAPRPSVSMATDENGQMQVRMTVNPLPTIDEWAVTSDGAVAIVRGRDYHVDWVNPDGSRMSSAKLPFDWKRMTDEDKEAFVDSLEAIRARQGPNAPMPFVAGMGGAPGGGAPQVTMRMDMREGGPPGAGGAPPRGETRISSSTPKFEFVPASELPDYRPPFFAGAVRADLQGNLWIRTTAAPTAAGASVWDVVDRAGTLVDRVQVPSGRSIIGFGADGTALLVAREGSNTTLEKAKLR